VSAEDGTRHLGTPHGELPLPAFLPDSPRRGARAAARGRGLFDRRVPNLRYDVRRMERPRGSRP
jgi:hypothetical protein